MSETTDTAYAFHTDRIKITGPRVDGAYTVTFEVGEHEYNQIKELPLLNDKTVVVYVKEADE